MKRKLAMFFTFFSLGIGILMAQTRVTGTVEDDSGNPVIGATIKVKGTSTATVTDANGTFSLSAPADGKLTVSYVGMQTVEVAVSPRIRIRLTTNEELLNEVVVTALGIKRSEKSLGYAASTVKSDELTRTTPVSITSGLTGKIAGLNISSSGGTGSSDKVIVRGIVSITGNNQPLYVVDGIPILNGFRGTAATNQAVDFGNQAGDINPEDVESVTVLKGASATALYGSRASTGVILITTKRGTTDSKVHVSYNGAVTSSNVLRVPQLQNMFGQGWPLLNQAGTPEPGLGENGSWGPALDGMMRKWGAPLNSNGIYDPTNGVQRQKPFAFVEDNMKNFYENGLELSNNISISAGNKATSMIFSFGNVSSDGVIPSNVDKYARNTFSLRGDATYKKFHISADMQYIRKDIRNVRGGQGGATGATTFQDLIQTPVDINYQDLKDYNNPYNNIDNFYTGYAQNPYWIIANNQSTYQDDRFEGRLELNYDIIKGLKAVGRLGGDFSNSRTKSWAAQVMQSANGWAMQFSSKSIPGNYEEYYLNTSMLDGMIRLDADYNLSKDFRLTANLGWNLSQQTTNSLDVYQGSLDVPLWYNVANGANLPTSSQYFGKKRIFGLFGHVDLSFKDWAFLGLDARNDWSSAIPKPYFWSGVNASVVLTDAIPSMKSDVFNYLKIRGSVGQTGKDGDIYLTDPKFVQTLIGLGFGNLYMPLNGISGLTESNTIYNKDLKPEITTESEVGFDLRMLNYRLGLDVALYNKNTKNQILGAQVSPESGYTSKIRNVGLINNRGIEVHLYGSPIKTNDFEWGLGVTYSKNVSKVKELWDNVTNYVYTTVYDINYTFIKDQPLGIFQVPKMRTVTDVNSPYYGKVVVNSSGLPQILSNEFTNVGSSNYDFTMGFTSDWTYKSFSLGVVVDYRQGGYFYSNTARMLDWNGNGTNTMFNARQPFVIPNSVKEISTGVYAENDIPLMTTGGVLNYWNYTSSNKGMEGNAILPRTYVKLRELSFNYSLPKDWFKNSVVSRIQIGIIGKNLLMWTSAKNNFVDPDISNYGNDLLSNIGEFSAAPSVRNIGLALKVDF